MTEREIVVAMWLLAALIAVACCVVFAWRHLRKPKVQPCGLVKGPGGCVHHGDHTCYCGKPATSWPGTPGRFAGYCGECW